MLELKRNAHCVAFQNDPEKDIIGMILASIYMLTADMK